MNVNKSQTISVLPTLRRVIETINVLSQQPHYRGVDEFLDLVTKLVKNHGMKHAIKLLKAYRHVLHQVALHQVVTNIPFCKTDKDNFPMAIKPWKISRSSTADDVKYVLSI